ncbi:MAG: BrnT family toxin [Pontibacterium sp.]
MIFEFDEAKSHVNLNKHGIDFLQAQRLWRDERLLEIPAKTEDEPRFVVIGKIGAWSRSPTRGCYPPVDHQSMVS